MATMADVVFKNLEPEDRALAIKLMEDMQAAFLPHMTANNLAFHNRFSALHLGLAFVTAQFIASMGGTVLANNGTDPEEVHDRMHELGQLFTKAFGQNMGFLVHAIEQQYGTMTKKVEEFRENGSAPEGEFTDVEGSIFEVKGDRITDIPGSHPGKRVH